MIHDPIIEEIRAIRDSIAKEHDYDIDTIFDAFRMLEQQDERNGRILVPSPIRALLETPTTGTSAR